MKPKETKKCAHCQKLFENRKSWKLRKQWETVKYCSTRCRKEASNV